MPTLYHVQVSLYIIPFENGVSVTAIQNTREGVRHATAFAPITVVGEARVPELASVAIIPGNSTVLKRQIYRLRAAGFDQDGLVIPGVSFVWKLNDHSLGRVNEIGYLTVEG